ncbi:hypothetical protein Gohar_004525 [Gossypium harknessii]|uniref:DUF4283 domain-containing protein n=1 Tax=Gossypium harknessii TaxID=34285 RepID=A0A7J9H7R7_9ROSI|nr:hypothetical protein [Gossypium harknessii]
MQVPLVFAQFWVQVYDLPSSLFSELLARQFRNFIDQFLEYDTKQDLPLRAQPRRVTTVDSIWLLKARDDGFFEANSSKRNFSHNFGKEAIEYDHEESPLEIMDGKKMHRFEKLNAKVFAYLDPLEITDEHVHRLQYMMKNYHPQLVSFMETKLSVDRMEKVGTQCCDHYGIDVHVKGTRGG